MLHVQTPVTHVPWLLHGSEHVPVHPSDWPPHCPAQLGVQPQTFVVPPPPQAWGATQSSVHVPPHASVPPHFPAQTVVQPQTFAVPPPPQVWGATQLSGHVPPHESVPPHLPAQVGVQQALLKQIWSAVQSSFRSSLTPHESYQKTSPWSHAEDAWWAAAHQPVWQTFRHVVQLPQLPPQPSRPQFLLVQSGVQLLHVPFAQPYWQVRSLYR